MKIEEKLRPEKDFNSGKKKPRKAKYNPKKEKIDRTRKTEKNNDARNPRGRNSQITSMMSGRKRNEDKKEKLNKTSKDESFRSTKANPKGKERKEIQKKRKEKESKKPSEKNSTPQSGRESRNSERIKRKNTVKQKEVKKKQEKPEEIEDQKTDAQAIYKEIQDQFMSALKKVEELEKMAGGNPISKISFKKELTKFLGACRMKAKKADKAAQSQNQSIIKD